VRRHVDPVRRRLLDATARLTYRNGVAATGVAEIVAEAGVARMSLYRHFPGGKDELVAAALEHTDDPTVDRLLEAAAARAEQPLGVLLAVFDVLHEQMQRPGWRGCRFLNATAELPVDHPARSAALAHKRGLERRLAHLALGAGVPACATSTVASHLLLLIDGTLAASTLRPQDAPALQARAMAEALLASRADSTRPQRARRA
jgi:AcrR family transcriptional regulator